MPHQTVETLIELVYAAACDPSEWQGLLAALSEAMGGSGADIASFNPAQSENHQVSVGVGIFGPEFRQEYLTSFRRSDPWFLRAQSQGLFRTGVVGIGEALLPTSELERTEFHNEFGKRHEFIGGLSGVIAADGTVGAAISIARRMQRPFGAREARLLCVLMPHLQRAFQVHTRLAEADARERGLREALDQMATGAILVAEDGAVLFANQSARDTLAHADGLTIDQCTLRGPRAKDTSAIRTLIRGAAQTGAGGGLLSGGVLTIGRPSGKRALQLVVSPLPSSADALIMPRARAIVLIADPDQTREPDVTLLRRLYGLTRMEAEVARLLLQNESVQEIGDALGVRANSVRFHLKQLFAKTDTRRQSQLVSLLLTTLYVHRPRC